MRNSLVACVSWRIAAMSERRHPAADIVQGRGAAGLRRLREYRLQCRESAQAVGLSERHQAHRGGDHRSRCGMQGRETAGILVDAFAPEGVAKGDAERPDGRWAGLPDRDCAAERGTLRAHLLGALARGGAGVGEVGEGLLVVGAAGRDAAQWRRSTGCHAR